MTFSEWMEAVDQVVADIAFGLSVYDTSRYSVQALPDIDIDFRGLYEAGETVQTGAEEALAHADFPFDALDYLD